jgi:hypothetical protein
MTLKPYQLALMAVGTFAAIVAANMAMQWRSNEEFRAKWESLNPLELAKARKAILSQENVEPAQEDMGLIEEE